MSPKISNRSYCPNNSFLRLITEMAEDLMRLKLVENHSSLNCGLGTIELGLLETKPKIGRKPGDGEKEGTATPPVTQVLSQPSLPCMNNQGQLCPSRVLLLIVCLDF